MAANTVPIYSIAGQVEWEPALLKTANLSMAGTGTVATIFTAGENGGRVERIRARPGGSNVATLLRIFINNGSATTVAANNILYTEKAIPAYTLSQTAVSTLSELPDTTDTTSFPIVLPAGYKLTATIGTTISSGLYVSAIGSTY